MKNPLLQVLRIAYKVLHLAFAGVTFCVIWKVTQHFWPFMNSVLRLFLAVVGGALVLQLLGNKFPMPKGDDEDRAE